MSKPPEKLKKQDQQLFSEAMSGIAPIEQDRIIPSSEKNGIFVPRTNFIDDASLKKNSNRLSDEYDPFENDQQRNDLNYHHVSISKKQFRDFSKGSYNSELILDLHGIKREQARNELLDFLSYCYDHDFRQVSIMPGYGYGVLRQALNLWLRQLPDVLAFAESPQRSGGKGVIRLLLKSNY